MRRREFIAGLGAAAASPVGGRGQQPGGRMRRIGVLIPVDDDERAVQVRTEFVQSLQQLGWTESRNITMDIDWAGSSIEAIQGSPRSKFRRLCSPAPTR